MLRTLQHCPDTYSDWDYQYLRSYRDDLISCDESPTLVDIMDLYGEDLKDALSDYPIWDEECREWLNSQIIAHFSYRQIASDTPAMFLFQLRRRMIEIMPKENDLFRFYLQDHDLNITATSHVDNVMTGVNNTGTVGNVTATSNSEGESKTDSDTVSEANTDALTSTFPQTQLSGAEHYATGLQENKSITETVATSETTEEQESVATTRTDEDVENTSRNESETDAHSRGMTFAQIMMDWQLNAVNPVYNVIEALEPLFMQIMRLDY